MSPEDARERAERLLVECGDGMSPTNLDGILRHLGGKIEQAQGVTASLAVLIDRPGKFEQAQGVTASLAVLIDRPGKFVLILRPLQSERGKRVEIARGIGRYLMEYADAGLKHRTYLTVTDSRELQTAGNVFASSLLMPTAPFTEAWRTGASEEDLSLAFKTSPLAVLTRSESLGLSRP